MEQEKTERGGTIAMVETLSGHLAPLSKGNLAHRIEHSFPHEYEGVRQDFNRTVERLNDIVMQVVETSDSIRTKAAEMRASSDDLSQRTESQAATLEEIAATLDTRAVTVK